MHLFCDGEGKLTQLWTPYFGWTCALGTASRSKNISSSIITSEKAVILLHDLLFTAKVSFRCYERKSEQHLRPTQQQWGKRRSNKSVHDHPNEKEWSLVTWDWIQCQFQRLMSLRYAKLAMQKGYMETPENTRDWKKLFRKSEYNQWSQGNSKASRS